jgi:hypothetical protein
MVPSSEKGEMKMAKYQLRQTGWPVSQFLIPQGTIIDTVAGTDGWSALVASLGLTPPQNAQPLDQATYNTMRLQFAAWQIFTVPGADGITRS